MSCPFFCVSKNPESTAQVTAGAGGAHDFGDFSDLEEFFAVFFHCDPPLEFRINALDSSPQVRLTIVHQTFVCLASGAQITIR